jgi:ABC-2 type transport system permease protein
MIGTVRVLRWSIASAFADFRAIYTWKTWIFAWLLRVLCQVAFYALIGRLLGSHAAVEYLLIGNAVFVGIASVLFIVPSTAWERATGTFPLLVASPTMPFVVFAGRSVQWLFDALSVSIVSLVGISALFGVRVPLAVIPVAVPILLVSFLSVYWFGLTIGGFILGRPTLRNVVGNVAGLTIMILGGVQVPTTFWPEWLQWVAHGLPASHGLLALRQLISGNGDVAGLVALELVVGLAWFIVAAATFRVLSERGRRTGAIEFGE